MTLRRRGKERIRILHCETFVDLVNAVIVLLGVASEVLEESADAMGYIEKGNSGGTFRENHCAYPLVFSPLSPFVLGSVPIRLQALTVAVAVVGQVKIAAWS